MDLPPRQLSLFQGQTREGSKFQRPGMAWPKWLTELLGLQAPKMGLPEFRFPRCPVNGKGIWTLHPSPQTENLRMLFVVSKMCRNVHGHKTFTCTQRGGGDGTRLFSSPCFQKTVPTIRKRPATKIGVALFVYNLVILEG